MSCYPNGQSCWRRATEHAEAHPFAINSQCFLCRADKSGQTALHWAAVRGSLLAGEALLSHGADLRIQDGRGYTSCHVAAQYGQTAFIYMCALRWRADIDRCASRDVQSV